jgi:nucleoside phosphorylase
MISDLSPRWIFLIGIAGGIASTEYTLGDVLLSQRMHDFAVSAAIEGKEPEFQDMGGPMMLEAEKLVTTLRSRKSKLGTWSSKEFIGRKKPFEKVPTTWKHANFYGDEDHRKSVLKILRGHFPKTGPIRDPIFRAAVILTSGVLLKDTQLASQWRKTARHASGVEMELGGVCRAARYGKDGQTRVLAIRGLSDIVGYKRAPEWTEFAAYSAAAFTRALIISGLIRRED